MSPFLSWQETWQALPQSLHASYQLQLKRELVPAHPLFGHACTPLGKHGGTDDVLVALANGQLAVVHLTWGGAWVLTIRARPFLPAGAILLPSAWKKTRAITDRP